jgi:hypothetical protein
MMTVTDIRIRIRIRIPESRGRPPTAQPISPRSILFWSDRISLLRRGRFELRWVRLGAES